MLSAKDHFQILNMEGAWPNNFVGFYVPCAISNGAGGIGALIHLAQDGSVRQ